MPRRCKRCREGETLSKPLFKCARCSRCYHSACHRPHPRETISNWVCKRCLAGRGQGRKRRLYHDSSLLASRAVSPSSTAPGLVKPRRTSMAPSPASDSATDTPTFATATSPTSSLSSQPNAGPIISCSFPGCSAKIDGKRQVLCEAHLHVVSKTDRGGDAPRTNGTHPAPAPAGAPSPPRQPMSSSNPRKLLPETDKDRPIMRRKTAGNLPQFMTQQPTPKHSTPPSRGALTMSPPSPRPLAPRPTVRSPPASLRDGEPAGKRQRLSPPPGHSRKAGVNGTGPSGPSTTESKAGKEPAQPGSPQFWRHSSNHSPQLSTKLREREGKTGARPNSRHFVRRIPLQLSNLRFIDEPGNGTSGVLSEQSSSGVNGVAGSSPRRSQAEETLSLNESVKDYRTAKKSDFSLSISGAESADSLGQTRRISELPDRHSQKALPERRSDTRDDSGLFQTRGNGVLSQRPQTTRFPIRRAQITKTQSFQLPKTKEIDASRFDSLIYSQPGASTPPPGVDVSPLAPPGAAQTADAGPQQKKEEGEDEPLYLDIDPRIHWPQPHSTAWYAARQKETRARGDKKANFGRAAQSLRKQQQLRGRQGAEFEDTLPEKILENPAWLRVLRRLGELPPQEDEEGNWAGNVEGGQGQQKKGRRSVVAGKRVGSGGMVVVTGLNGLGVPK